MRAYQTLSFARRLNPADRDTTDLCSRPVFLSPGKAFPEKNMRSLGYLQEASRLRAENALIHRRMADAYALLARLGHAERKKREADQLEGVRR